jgi:hypothetical protein
MNTRTRAGRRAAALAAGVVALLAGCGAQPEAGVVAEPEKTVAVAPIVAAAVAPPAEPGFDYADPQEVCRRFAAAFYSADTTRDTGPGDAYARAARYMDGALAGQSAAAERDGRWHTWAEHRARLETRVDALTDPHQSPDSTTTAYRAAVVVTTPVGEDGWRGWSETSSIYCTLRANDTGWRVAHYDIYAGRR